MDSGGSIPIRSRGRVSLSLNVYHHKNLGHTLLFCESQQGHISAMNWSICYCLVGYQST